jgi:energy-coupling factor transporter ATP-binding protein EcfA2
MKDVQYYCVGFIWRGANPEDQLPRFISEGIWENGYDDNKYVSRINNVAIGSRLAAKTTYTKKEDGISVSILEIYATGTVTDNPKDGQILKVRWDKEFERFIIRNRGAYRSTINRINQLDVIKEIFKVDEEVLRKSKVSLYSDTGYNPDKAEYPCFVFNKSKWDDFNYKTQFDLDFYESSRKKITVGPIKIFAKDQIDTVLPDAFTSLGESFCSLGQNNDYYKRLNKEIDKDISNYLLDSINDVTYNKGLLGDFEHEDGFKTSLLRSSEAQKALREGGKIYAGLDIDNILHFTFSAQIGRASRHHSIVFDFSEKEGLPYRVKVLIGKNGTGKTQYISKLASTLSGYESQGVFSTKYLPPFSRVIAISYSLFDRFPRPQQTKTFSYYYSGFQGPRGLLSESQVQSKIKRAFAQLEKSGRIQLFGKYLAEVLTDEIVSEILDEDQMNLNSREFALLDEDGYSKFSSGQIIMILILSEILAYITHESLLIFDEPETHLHPNSISLFINVVNRILTRFHSYAIISTHSPQVVQEIPSKDIKVVERIGDTPSVRGLDIETFGENLNAITERIFHTISQDEYYRMFLKTLSKTKTYEQIVEIFERNSLPLSFNARIYLQSLFQK